MTLSVDSSGTVVVPAELIQARPETKLEAQRFGDSIMIRPAGAEHGPLPQASILDLPTTSAGPLDPNVTFRRADIYGDDGR